jgi:hypothetical protein
VAFFLADGEVLLHAEGEKTPKKKNNKRGWEKPIQNA